MDFIQIIFGRYIIEFLGALIRYIYINIGSDNYTPFSKIWSPKGNDDKKNENGSLNHMIGTILFIIIIVIIIFLE